MTAVAHGGDATGSLRYPAACCGVTTLKPSRGRMPQVTPAGMPDPMGLWTEFVLAHSVRDLASILDAVGGGPVMRSWRHRQRGHTRKNSLPHQGGSGSAS